MSDPAITSLKKCIPSTIRDSATLQARNKSGAVSAVLHLHRIAFFYIVNPMCSRLPPGISRGTSSLTTKSACFRRSAAASIESLPLTATSSTPRRFRVPYTSSGTGAYTSLNELLHMQLALHAYLSSAKLQNAPCEP